MTLDASPHEEETTIRELLLVLLVLIALALGGVLVLGRRTGSPAMVYMMHVFVAGPLLLFVLGMLFLDAVAARAWLLVAASLVLTFAHVRHLVRTGLANSAALDDGKLHLELRNKRLSLAPDEIAKVGRIRSSPWMPVPGHMDLGTKALLVESRRWRAIGPFRWVVPVESSEAFLLRLDAAGFPVTSEGFLW